MIDAGYKGKLEVELKFVDAETSSTRFFIVYWILR